MRWARARLLAVAAGLAVLAIAPGLRAGGEKEARVSRIDRTKVVGAPVLDAGAAEGVYVWLQDGVFRVAAVSRARRPRTIILKVESTRPLKVTGKEDFRARAGGRSTVLSARVGSQVARGAFETEGDVTVSRPLASARRALPLFLGPLAEPAAGPVTIGRF